MNDIIKTIEKFSQLLKGQVPSIWNGKTAILEMKTKGSRQWRQMEWIGFYFEYKCQNILKSDSIIPSPHNHGRVVFDCFREIEWDFKTHPINTSSHQIIVNDSIAIEDSLKKFGYLGLILALGEVEYNDVNRTFQKWHDEIKGAISKYTIERVKRGAWSRLRKVEFKLKQISFILISSRTLEKCGSFQKDFRNADGSPRNSKVLLDLEKIDEELVHCIEF